MQQLPIDLPWADSPIRWTIALIVSVLLALAPRTMASERWVESRWSNERTPVDFGLGVVTFRQPGAVPADSMTVRAAPSPTSPVRAYLILRGNGMAWRYVISSPDSPSPNFLEYGGEECGVPIDSVARAQGWVRVAYASTSEGGVNFGWVRAPDRGHGIILWTESLPQNALFFQREIAPQFRSAPRSDSPLIEIQISGQDYIMHPLEVRGAWMKVRLAAPSDYCGEGIDRGEYWIEYLDARGRPRVWYYARGC